MSKQAKNYIRSKGKKPAPKGKGQRKYAEEKDDSRFESNSKTHNDVSWYTPDQQILNDVARLPYSIPTGMPISRPYDTQGATGTDFAIPGILVQKVMPTLGYANNPSDPVNIAAQGVYSFVRHLNSGSRNYDPVDLMIYIGALDSVYSCISWCTRIYATICSYAQGNRYLPRLLMESQGLDFDNIANNMVQFRAALNQRIAKASQLMVPNVMPIFERHRWLFANYYIEGDDIKDQIYLYCPIGFHKFQLDSTGAGMLKAVRLKSIRNQLLWTDLITLLDTMLDPIIEDEDFNIMSGDIFKAYAGNIVTYSMIPDLMAMNFTYDENVLLQFKNSKSIPVNGTSSGFGSNMFDYTQDPNKRFLQMAFSPATIKGYTDVFTGFTQYSGTMSSTELSRVLNTLRAYSKPILITSPHRSVEAPENMVSTRGTMAAEMTLTSIASTSGFKFVYFGSEWYESFEVWNMIRNRSNGNVSSIVRTFANVVSFGLDLTSPVAATIETFFGELLSSLAQVSKFKYHPEVQLTFNGLVAGTNIGNDTWSDSMFDVDNYSAIDYNVVKGLHDAALLGEYNVPRIALLPS